MLYRSRKTGLKWREPWHIPIVQICYKGCAWRIIGHIQPPARQFSHSTLVSPESQECPVTVMTIWFCYCIWSGRSVLLAETVQRASGRLLGLDESLFLGCGWLCPGSVAAHGTPRGSQWPSVKQLALSQPQWQGISGQAVSIDHKLQVRRNAKSCCHSNWPCSHE